MNSTNDSSTPCNCVVLLSGGIDSTACVDFYLKQAIAVSGLHVSYGQPAAQREEEAARTIASHYRIPLSVVKMAGSRAKSHGETLGRNAFLIFTALMELDVSRAMVALGVHSGTPYYDCSKGFVKAAQAIVDGQCDGRIRLAAPFLEWTKREIWEYCLQRSVPIDHTYSCEKGLDQPCGNCISCRDLEALSVCKKHNNPT